MDKRIITCINDDGVSVAFGESFSPFVLISVEGLYEIKNNLFLSDGTTLSGATYQGSVTQKRNIVLSLSDKVESDHRANREVLYELFKPDSEGELIYSDGEIQRAIGYYVESIVCPGSGRIQRATVSLMCPDPFFTEPSDLIVEMAGWEPRFEFPFEPTKAGFVFGSRVQERLKTIDNQSASERIGLDITMEAIGQVINPAIEHVQKRQHIAIGTSTKKLEMVSGDKIRITTADGNKRVTFIRDGVESNINHYLSEDSEFIQLSRGENSIGYTADEGYEYLMVTIVYRYQYLGV